MKITKSLRVLVCPGALYILITWTSVKRTISLQWMLPALERYVKPSKCNCFNIWIYCMAYLAIPANPSTWTKDDMVGYLPLYSFIELPSNRLALPGRLKQNTELVNLKTTCFETKMYLKTSSCQIMLCNSNLSKKKPVTDKKMINSLKLVFQSLDNSSYLPEFENQKARNSWTVKVSIILLVIEYRGDIWH